MATVTKGRTFVSGEVVTPTKLNALVDSATVSGIKTADIDPEQITLDRLVATVQQALLPAGAVQAFAMNAAPAGWLAANGSAVSRTAYAALFAAIGTTYGAGDGSTTFALPDLRGYFVRGAGTNGDGSASGTFGNKIADMVGQHNHTITDPGHVHSIADPGHAHSSYAWTYYGGSQGGTGRWWFQGGGGTAINSQDYSVATSGSGTGISINNNKTGISVDNNSGTETRPKNIAMLYCIKF